MAIQTQYCRCWYLISAACMITYAQAADVTWLQWTVQPASYIGMSSETSLVSHSDVAAKCESEGGAIIDPTVVDVTSQEFASLILECFNFDITNSIFWVNRTDGFGYCAGIVYLRGIVFDTTSIQCTTTTRYICHSTQNQSPVVCTNDTTTGESPTTETTTGQSPTTETITGETTIIIITTGESSTTDNNADETGADITVYAGAAAGGVVLVVAIVVVVCCTRRKNNHDKQRQPGDQEAPEVSKSTENKSDDTRITPIVPSYELVPNNFMPKPEPVEETEKQETEQEEQHEEDVSPYAEYDGGAAVVDIPPANNTPEKSRAADFKPGDNDKPPDIESLYSDVRKDGAPVDDAVVNEDKEKVTTPDADMYASVNKPKREASEGDLDDEDTADVVVDNPLYSSM